MARLTNAEKKLLTYPPTEQTWICSSRQKRGGEVIECGLPNSGTATECWMCQKPKLRPKLVWPLYVKACKKAGIEPGSKWQPVAPVPAAPKSRSTRIRRKAG